MKRRKKDASDAVSHRWKFEFHSDGQVPAFVIGAEGLRLAPMSTPLTGATGSFTIGRVADGGPAWLVGSATGTRLELGKVQIGIDFTLSPARQAIDLAADADQGVLVISPGDGDGFLQRVLPDEGLHANIDFGLVLSSDRGLVFRGSAGLDTTLPVDLSLGPVSVPTVHLGLQAGADGLSAEASASVALSIGPVDAVIDRVGINAAITFPADGGNLGVVDLTLGFKPPSGVGLAIDVAGLVGGGFLAHDEAAAQYAGMLQLEFERCQLQAFGLIATRLPTGPGYALLAMIDAEFPPIQLGFGFMLTGAGGLFGLNRTASIDALRAAFKAHTLSSFLFPKDPIANAPQLLSELQTIFPPAEGRYLFGPLAHIEWGKPALLTIDLALILELPAPVRLVLVGALTVLLPSPDEVLIELHMDVLGTIDSGKGEAALDAALHDSRLLKFPLHGSMAFRWCWVGKKVFLLGIGGFHPRFEPPPGFPTLERLSISMSATSLFKLNLNGYLARTVTGQQFGAHLDLFVGVADFGVSGYLNFDTLIQLWPFHFDADISGGVALTFEGEDLMSLHLEAALSGPAPWHVEGKFSFDLLFWSVSKSFSKTFGDPLTELLVELVDVGQALRTALADASNFSASLAAAEGALVTFRAPAASGAVLVHPGAGLSVHQKVVPLGLTISRFGNAMPAGDTLFTIDGLLTDGQTQSTTPLLDDFAPGQFLTRSDDEELTSPSFEQLGAGVELSSAAATFGYASAPSAVITRGMTYETFLVDTPDGPLRPDATPIASVPTDRLDRVLAVGAAGRSLLGRSGTSRYAGPVRQMVRGEIEYLVATTDQVGAAGVGAPAGQSYSQARAALAAEVAQHPERRGLLQVVPGYEAR
jgi:hypothetical protein